MISRTFGASFGGTTRGAHQGVDSEAFSLMTPPNFGSGGGSCLPSMVVVALGEPGTPVTCWAILDTEEIATAIAITICLFILISFLVIGLLIWPGLCQGV